MKNYYSLIVTMGVATCSAFTLNSCKKDEIINVKDSVFFPSDQPLGKSHEEWAQEWWRTVMLLDCFRIFP